MKAPHLLRSLRRLANKRGWDFETKEGGNHTKVRLNGRATVLPRHATDLPNGTYRAILKQLGITQADVED